MKIVLEITGLTSGKIETSNRNWLRLNVRDRGGRNEVAVCFDQAAENVEKAVMRLVPEGEDVASQRLLVDLTGEFRDGRQIVRGGKPVVRQDGSPVLSRQFWIESFRLLTGPQLEKARMQRDADLRLTRAEKLAADGDFKGAYRVLGEFAANLCARPFEMAETTDENLEDEIFGDTSEAELTSSITPAGQDNPEAAAAAIFAREDAVADAPVTAEAKPEPVPEASNDVLDDNPAPEAEAAPVVEAPAIAPEAPAVEEPAQEAPQAAPAPAPRERRGFGRRPSFGR
jgi:hypothetical protein